jgi:hypothetical protein
MKKIFLPIALSLFILSCSNNNSNDEKKGEDLKKSTENKPILKEELPPLKTCKSDIGKVKTDENGSVGSKTEMTELKKLLKNKDCDILEVTFIQKSPPDRNYEDMPLKVIYNRITGNLKNIFTQRNVIEEYKNVNEKCLLEFLQSGQQHFLGLSDFCKDTKYEFNNKEMKETAIGIRPEQSELNGSVKIVSDFIKSNAKDPSSVEFLEWSKVISIGENWTVRCKYKGTNSLGTIVTENTWFYIQNSKVVESKSI